MDKKDFKNILILIPLSIFAFFSNIWVRPADLMEARNFITAREMIKNDNFVITTLNENLRFEKPPLPTWFTAFVMKITGNITDEWVLRIPVAVIGILFIIFLYYFVKTTTENRLKSFITAFVGATTFMIIKIGNENSWDMYPYVFAFGAVTFILNGLKTGKTKYFVLGGILTASSILSKGPVGIYGLILPFFMAHIYVYGSKDYKKNWKNFVLMVITAVVLAGIWPMAVYLKYPDVFLSVLNKEKNTWMNNHTESFIYYMDYFIYMGIWIFFSVMTLAKSWNKNRTDNKNFSKFIFLWNIFIIILISIIKMKKKRYGLPIYMTSIISVGNISYYYYNRAWEELKKSDKILLGIQGGFMALVSFLVPFILFTMGYLKGDVKGWYVITTGIIFIPFSLMTVKALINKKIFKNISVTRFIIFGSGTLMLLANLSTNWFLDRTIIKNSQGKPDYPKIKMVQKNPPALNIYSDSFEIEDVWRVGKEIKTYDENIYENLPDSFIFFGKIPEKIINDYKILKKEIYMKDDGYIAEMNYLEKI